MNQGVELPDPWLHVAYFGEEDRRQLEAVLGSRLGPDELTDDDFVTDPVVGKLPFTERAKSVLWHRWAHLRNVDTDVEAYVRLQLSNETGKATEVTAVAFPQDMTRSLVGTDLRSLPVAAIAAAYTKHENDGVAHLQIALTLGDDFKSLDPLQPLPAASANSTFAARVALQFMKLEESTPSHKVPRAMADLNGTPLSTIQRWIARARKGGYLPPASPHSRRQANG